MNGTHVSENPFLIRDVLRKEWGSDALVMSDWWVIPLPDRAYWWVDTSHAGPVYSLSTTHSTLVSISRCRVRTNGEPSTS